MLASDDTSRYVTAAEYLVHSDGAKPGELVRGTTHVMSPAGGIHGLLVGRIFALLNAFVETNRLGLCFADNTGFELTGLPDTVRSPDAAFISAARLPAEGIGAGWITATPDLVVEVVSPSEPARELEEKLADYRAAGTRVFWIIDPAMRSVIVRDGDAAELLLAETDRITNVSCLPGLSVDIARLFDGLARSRESR